MGLHTSTAGALENSAVEAVRVGANCFEIFSSSPRMWRALTPDPTRVAKLRELRAKLDLYPLVIHTNYLINLASSDEALLRQSIEAFHGELDRAAIIGAEFLVLHPGNAKGHANPEAGLDTIAAAVAVAARGLESRGVTLLLKTPPARRTNSAPSSANSPSCGKASRDSPSCPSGSASTPATHWRPATMWPPPPVSKVG